MFSFAPSDRVANMSNNELVVHLLNNPIVSHMDAAKRLVENRKLVARGDIHGQFCDKNEPFELKVDTLSTLQPSRRKMVVHILIDQ